MSKQPSPRRESPTLSEEFEQAVRDYVSCYDTITELRRLTIGYRPDSILHAISYLEWRAKNQSRYFNSFDWC